MHFTPIEFWKLFVPHTPVNLGRHQNGNGRHKEAERWSRARATDLRHTYDVEFFTHPPHTMLRFPTWTHTHTHKHVHVFFMCFFFFGISEYFMPELSQKETRRSKPRGLEPCVHSHGSLWMSNCWSERSEIVSQHLERAGTEWLFL